MLADPPQPPQKNLVVSRLYSYHKIISQYFNALYKEFKSLALPHEQHFSQNVLELQLLGEKQVTASHVQHSSFFPFGIESAFRLFFTQNKDQCLFISVVHIPTQYTLLSLLEGASQRLSCRVIKKSSSPKPGKIEMSLFTRSFRRETKHLLQYRPSILWPSLETFKINFKSFLYSFHIPSISSLFYYEIASVRQLRLGRGGLGEGRRENVD